MEESKTIIEQKTTKRNSTRLLIGGGILVVALLLLVAFLLLRAKQSQNSQHRDTVDSQGVTKPSEAGARDIDLVINGGKIVTGSNEVKVHKGERVYIHIKTQDAQPMKLRLDGYDILTEMNKYDYGGFLFTADKTGSFNIELFSDDESTEAAGKVVGVVTVE